MSLAWMSRVWASERPRRSTHRLLLLALADNANDEGVCWPSVATLGRKCATDDRRTMLRQLAWLETEGFLERERRVGRSTVYRLLMERLGDGAQPAGDRVPPGDAEPTGGAAPMGEEPRGGRAPTGGGVAAHPPMGDGAPTPPVALRPPKPSENPQKNPQQQHPTARVRLVVPGAEGQAPDAAVMREREEDAVELLVRRGVDRPVAEELERAHSAGSVREAVALYDERRRGPKPPNGPGWLVAAIRRGFSGAAKSKEALLEHGEMLRWCEANGGLHRTAEFEPVSVEAGHVLFRRRAK